MKKIFSVLMASVLTFSLASVQVFAADNTEWGWNKEDIVWTYETGSIDEGLTLSACFKNGHVETITKFHSGIVVAVPEGVEPTKEYFGFENISEIKKFEEKSVIETLYWDQFYEITPEKNEYIIKFSDKSIDEQSEIARKLLESGKIESARKNNKCTKYKMGGVSGIYFESSGEVKLEDFSEISSILEKYKCESAFSKENDKYKYFVNVDTASAGKHDEYAQFASNILDTCKLLAENNEEIAEARPIVMHPLDTSTDSLLNMADYVYMWGDVSKDNSIDIRDAIGISKHIMKTKVLDEDTTLLADINRDGKTNIVDAIDVAKKVMK